MANLFTITIPDSAAALLVTYGAGALIRVQSSPTAAGVYGEVVTIAIVSGVSVYSVYDPDGEAGYSYKYRYEASDGDPAGSYSAAFQPTPGHAIYATRAQLKADLGMPSAADAVQDPMLDIALAAAAAAIRSACQRDFSTPSGVSEARYFPLFGYAPPYIEIDDLVDSTGLAIAFDDGTGTWPTSITTTYDLLPLNAPTKGRPYNHISFRAQTGQPGYRLTGPIAEVTSARWGWPSIPAAVTQANLIQASRLYKRKDSPFGIAGSPAEGNILRLLAKLDPDVQLLLADYVRYVALVA